MPEPIARRAAVLLGGALGTALRLAVILVVPVGVRGFPWPTLLVNVTGAAALGFLVHRLRHRAGSHLVLALVGTGLLGSYTTFSTFALEVVQLIPRDATTAAVYGAASVTLGVLAAWGGAHLASWREEVPA